MNAKGLSGNWCLGSEQEHACFYPWNPHDYVELMEI